MTEDGIRSLLQRMRDEPVPADSLVRVRERVEAAMARKRRWWWWALPAPALAACAAALLLWPREVEFPPLHAPPAPAVAQAPQPGRARPAVQPVLARAAQPGTNVVIRIETDDPDVVILLVD